MRRKQTKLENNLYELGYRLDHKTYCGKKSEKVDQFVFMRNTNNDTYYVYLNRERTKIDSFSFTSNRYIQYNAYSIDDIKETYETLKNSLKDIYDFENQVAKDYVNVKDVSEFENPFVEESIFDND